MFGYDLRDVSGLYHGIKGSIRVNDHNRAQGTEAVAAGFYNRYFLLQSLAF
jgi:hypothetical protein